jgi:hypothetical protein
MDGRNHSGVLLVEAQQRGRGQRWASPLLVGVGSAAARAARARPLKERQRRVDWVMKLWAVLGAERS